MPTAERSERPSLRPGRDHQRSCERIGGRLPPSGAAPYTCQPPLCPALRAARALTPNTEGRSLRTFTPTPKDITRAWHVVDAEGLVLGRVATEVARILRGKHKPIFAPHMDTGDHVIIINCDKIVLTAGKAEKKLSYRHSGYPGGLRSTSYTDLLAKKPQEAVRKAVKGMLPKNRLGAQ